MSSVAANPNTSSPIDLVEIIMKRKTDRAANMARRPSNFDATASKMRTPLDRESELDLARRRAWPEYYTDLA